MKIMKMSNIVTIYFLCCQYVIAVVAVSVVLFLAAIKQSSHLYSAGDLK